MIHPTIGDYSVPKYPFTWVGWFQKPTLIERNHYNPFAVLSQYGRTAQTNQVRAQGSHDDSLGQ